MTVAVPRPLRRRRLVVFALPRLDARAALLAVVCVSAAIRAALAWLRATPVYFPDEYIYTAIGRSIAERGIPTVRDAGFSFPALLQPILTAPAWLVSDPAVSFRLVQTLGAIAMSLAAVPVYFLARRLGIGSRLAVGLSALAVAIPDLLYSSRLLAEPFAYPLVLGAFAAGVVALNQPTWRTQGSFLALSTLATLSRIQFVVIPLCFAAAALLLGLRERRLRAVLREQRLPLALLLSGVVGGLGAGGVFLGIYHDAGLRPDIELAAMLDSTGRNLLVLAYTSGWALVPGAIIGLALTLWRPLSRSELAFGLFATLLSIALLFEAGAYGDVHLVQERYLFYLAPLVALFFSLYAARAWPFRLWHALVAATLVTVSAVVPLAGYSAGEGKRQSPFLLATAELERLTGSPGTGSAVVAGAALFISLVVFALSGRPRLATPVAIGLATCGCAAAYASAASFDVRSTDALARWLLSEERSWVDDRVTQPVMLVRSAGGDRAEAMSQMFWNRSIGSVLLLPDAKPLDAFGQRRIRIARDGSLSVEGRRLSGPLLVDGYGSSVVLTGARRLARSPASSLWQLHARPRLSLYFRGRYHDNWLAGGGTIGIWSSQGRVEGRLLLRLAAPAHSTRPVKVRIGVRGGRKTSVRLAPASSQQVAITVCSLSPWQGDFRADVTGSREGRLVSVRAIEARFESSPSTCIGR